MDQKLCLHLHYVSENFWIYHSWPLSYRFVLPISIISHFSCFGFLQTIKSPSLSWLGFLGGQVNSKVEITSETHEYTIWMSIYKIFITVSIDSWFQWTGIIEFVINFWSHFVIHINENYIGKSRRVTIGKINTLIWIKVLVMKWNLCNA